MHRVFIIAEAGVNHNGSIDIAKKMVDAAVESGADAIKFQTFIASNLISKYAKKAEYQQKNTGCEESQLEMIKKLELSFNEFLLLKEYCKEKGILFLSTAFDLESLDMLDRIGIPIYKIPSGEITNLPYLIKLGRMCKPIIVSSGMCEMYEIKNALSILKENGASDITVLHCNTEYPTPYQDVNLKAMLAIKDEFNVKVGYSDHTIGIEVPIAAVALGADVIEKHFTLDKNMEGPDHIASLEPYQLKEMISCIRHIEAALGDGVKRVSSSEMKNIEIARKSIVAKKNIRAGDIFNEDNITVKRPAGGISPMKWFDVIGKVAVRDFAEDEMIEI